MEKIFKLQDIKDKKPVELFNLLKSRPEGLSENEAKKRLELYGSNDLKKRQEINPIVKFVTYFKDPMIIILTLAAIISAATGSSRSAMVIGAMILMSVLLNFYQEHKSNRAAAKIAARLNIFTTALRQGKKSKIAAHTVVPGDIILLSAGDIVPSDGIILEADDFFLNESVLTGESLPVEKSADQSHNLVFSGTNVVSGFSKMLTIKTGEQTEFGSIAKNLDKKEEANAFELGIKKFGFLIIRTIAIIVAIIFLLNAILKKDVVESLIFSIAVAVGVMPELLPMIISVTMSRGSIRMSKRGVLVKKLNSIPDFGSMDILCTDKTGTLTQDKITVIKHVDPFGKDSRSVFENAYINGYFETGIKSLLDQAILDHDQIETSSLKKIEEIPYDFNRKRSSIICAEGNNLKMISKGAPEEIFKICSYYQEKEAIRSLDESALKKVKATYDDLSREGLRVLAVASKEIKEQKKVYRVDEETGLILLGFMAFYDPPKLSAKETLKLMKTYGVEIKILTGDAPLVTQKICSELNLQVKQVISGDEIDLNKLSDDELFHKARPATICARLSPSQKERIISVLRKNNLVVGYLGDGINDAPALKSADVGISVDNAVDVAKESADIILMKKGLQELMDGVIEGRKTFGNTMKYLMMGLSSNFGNMFSMIGATIFLPFFPMTAGQILFNNFLYDVSQLSIPSDRVDQEYLIKPKHWDIRFIKRYMIVFGPISSLFDFLTFFLLYKIFALSGGAFQAGWFIESLATQTLVIYIIRTKKIPFLQSAPSWALVSTTLAAVGTGLLFVMTNLKHILGFDSLSTQILLVLGLLVICYLLMVEITKRIFYHYTEAKIPSISHLN
ncbi:MAG: magnesium-translocating P-type ATPase [Patescibacteria group bacterium]